MIPGWPAPSATWPLREAAHRDPGWLQRAGGPLGLPPLVAVTHSCLLRLPEFAEPLRACARWLLDAGADPLQTVGNRWPPASLQAPSGPSGCQHSMAQQARTMMRN